MELVETICIDQRNEIWSIDEGSISKVEEKNKNRSSSLSFVIIRMKGMKNTGMSLDFKCTKGEMSYKFEIMKYSSYYK